MTGTLNTYNARPCDTAELRGQLGIGTILAISGGRTERILNETGETVGLRLPIDGERRVDIVLDWSDTYIVRRVRRVKNGAQRGTDVVEYERENVYCDEVSEITYQASVWK